MSGMVDPSANAGPRLEFDMDGMRCECGGTGAVKDAAKLGGGWRLVIWQTEHRPGCEGRQAPERAYLLDGEAFAAGDRLLPGVDPEEMRVRPLPPPAGLAQCEGYAYTTGQRCRNRAGPDGRCYLHGRRP